jgi:hypothetical protein
VDAVGLFRRNRPLLLAGAPTFLISFPSIMQPTWRILRTDDGSFDVLRNGKLYYWAIPDSDLEKQLSACGITGKFLSDAMRQLATSNEAVVANNTVG